MVHSANLVTCKLWTDVVAKLIIQIALHVPVAVLKVGRLCGLQLHAALPFQYRGQARSYCARV